MVAERMGCDSVGIELKPEHAQQATERLLLSRKRVWLNYESPRKLEDAEQEVIMS